MATYEEFTSAIQEEKERREKDTDMVIPMWRYDELVIAEHELKAARERLLEMEVKLKATEGYLDQVREKLSLTQQENVKLRKTLSEYEDRSMMEVLAMRDRGVIIQI